MWRYKQDVAVGLLNVARLISRRYEVSRSYKCPGLIVAGRSVAGRKLVEPFVLQTFITDGLFSNFILRTDNLKKY